MPQQNELPTIEPNGGRVSPPENAALSLNARPGLVFVTGWGGAGFHSPTPALTRGREGIFPVIPALPPSGAYTHSFPGRGPVSYHVFLTGTCLGYGWGRGQSRNRGRECRKIHPALGH